LVNLTANGSSGSATICSGDAVNLQASGGSTYTWSGGISGSGSSKTVYPTSQTNYTVSSGSGACISSQSVTVYVNQPPGAISTTASPSSICIGGSSTISASSIGATTYSWTSLGNGSSKMVNPLSQTTYYVSASNSCGSQNGSVIVYVNALPTVMASSSLANVCSGSSVTLSASGAVNYSWNTGQTGASIPVSPTSNTSYTVTGTDANGCTNTATVSVSILPDPTISASSNPPTLCSNTSATLLATGNAVSYAWSGGGITGNGTSLTINPTTTTTYTLVGTGTNGCTATTNITVTVSSQPTVNASSSLSTVCSGSSVTLSASGATTYLWNTGQTGTSISVNPTSNTAYTVTGTDNNGCTNTATVNLNVIPSPTISALSTPSALCENSSATLSVSGNATSYSWSGGGITGSGTSQLINPTSTTTYTLIGVSNNGCTDTATVIVTVNTLPTVSASSSASAICTGSSATLSASGAVNYSWDSGQSGAVISVTPTSNTTYTVTGTDNNGCTNTAIVNVNVNPIPSVNISTANSTICSGTSITLQTSGASTYLWDNASTNGQLTVSPTTNTTYQVTGTDSNGCTNTANIAITVNAIPPVSITSSDTIVCLGSSTTLTASGADTYLWSNGLTSPSITVSPTSTTSYNVIGTSSGCSSNAIVQTLTVLPLPNINISASETTICSGGSVTLTASGSSSYLWNNGLTNSSITVSPTSTTTYSVVDPMSLFIDPLLTPCASYSSFTVNVIALPTLTIVPSTSSICKGSSVVLTVNGADTYVWSTGSTESVITVSPEITTTYSVTGENSGCPSSSISETISVLPSPTVSITASADSVCMGGLVVLTASGADSYVWSNGLPGAIITVGPANTTTYTVTGTSGSCSGTHSYTVEVLSTSLNVDFVDLVDTTCFGETNGSVTALASGGTEPYMYAWSNGNFSSTINNLSAGMYQVVVTDGSGCSHSQSIEIHEIIAESISLISEHEQVACIGSSVELFVPQSFSSYLWKGPGNYASNQQNIILNNIDIGQSGWYYISTTDNNGCKIQDSIYLEVEFQQECFKLPEIITPNGDNMNDTWIVHGLDYFSTKELVVFNRWGNTVYKNNNYKNEWDGRANKGTFIKEGKRLPNGTYFYILTLKNDNGSYLFKGFIELQY